MQITQTSPLISTLKQHKCRRDEMGHSLLTTLLTVLCWGVSRPLIPQGRENTTIRETGETISYEWYLEPMENKLQAVQFCESHDSTIPTTEELKYFYKSLILPNDFVFYLNNTLETSSSPNEGTGERMCITVRTSLGLPVSSQRAKAKITSTTEN